VPSIAAPGILPAPRPRRILCSLLAALLLLVLPHAAWAWPDGPVRIVVPFAAGGPTDTLARLVAQAMTRNLGQQVTVENVTGAGGTLGAARVAKAAPDGHTLLLINLSQATSARMYRHLPYDPIKSFAPIGLVADVPMTIVARADLPIDDLAGLIEHLRVNEDSVAMGAAGLGTSSHLCRLLLTSATHTTVIDVPYQGTAPALQDLLGGQIDLLCDQTSGTTGYIRSGRIRAYALTAEARLPTLPDLPTAAEAGLPQLNLVVWHGLYAPAGTSPAIVERLSTALQAAVGDPEVVERMTALGGTMVPAGQAVPAALAAKLAAETARLGAVLDAAGVQAY
jgi:tripartite-type tricarboxylate transporter receptor subunit TctC